MKLLSICTISLILNYNLKSYIESNCILILMVKIPYFTVYFNKEEQEQIDKIKGEGDSYYAVIKDCVESALNEQRNRNRNLGKPSL